MEKVTVGQLIECLEKFDRDLPVGVIGHYGEYFEFPIDFIRKKILIWNQENFKKEYNLTV